MKTFRPLLNPVRREENSPFRPKITGLSRVAFRTCDLDNTCRFFTDFLGYGRHTADFTGKERPSSLTIRINGRQHVELLCALPDDVCGLDSFVLETDNAAALRHYLESKGCTVLDAESRTGCFRPDFWVIASSGAAYGFVQRADAPDSDPGSADSGISRRISHVGFMTPDPKAAMAFFIGVLGFREIWRGGPDPTKVAWVHLGLPEGNETIELMLAFRAASGSGRYGAYEPYMSGGVGCRCRSKHPAEPPSAGRMPRAFAHIGRNQPEAPSQLLRYRRNTRGNHGESYDRRECRPLFVRSANRVLQVVVAHLLYEKSRISNRLLLFRRVCPFRYLGSI